MRLLRRWRSTAARSRTPALSLAVLADGGGAGVRARLQQGGGASRPSARDAARQCARRAAHCRRSSSRAARHTFNTRRCGWPRSTFEGRPGRPAGRESRLWALSPNRSGRRRPGVGGGPAGVGAEPLRPRRRRVSGPGPPARGGGCVSVGCSLWALNCAGADSSQSSKKCNNLTAHSPASDAGRGRSP